MKEPNRNKLQADSGEQQLAGTALRDAVGVPDPDAGQDVDGVLPQRVNIQFKRAGFNALLRTLAQQAGGVNALAAQLGVSGQFLDKVINNGKKPGRTIMQRLGARIEQAEPVYVVPFTQSTQDGEAVYVTEWRPEQKKRGKKNESNSDHQN